MKTLSIIIFVLFVTVTYPMKLTICQNCKTKFKHDKNQERKYCSQSCSTIMKNKLSAKPKIIRTKKISSTRREWRNYWNLYFCGHVTIQDIKNLMRERYTSLRSEIVESQNYGN